MPYGLEVHRTHADGNGGKRGTNGTSQKERSGKMSVLIKGMKMPKNCHECDTYGISDVVGLRCPEYCLDNRPTGCPLVEVPPHGDLIDKEVLYNKTAEWEAQAMAQIEKLNRIPFDEMEREEYIAWRAWSALYQERSAFKFDVFDSPIVIEAEGESDGQRTIVEN